MNDTGKRFVRDTYYDRVSEPDQGQGLPQPPLETPEEGERITLPAPDTITMLPLDLRAAIELRRSLRKYADISFSLEELAYLLWTTQGVREVIERPTVRVTFRTVPSAGARHALDTYLLANRVEGLEPGLYRYMAVEHALVRLPRPASIAADLTEACLGQAFVGTCAATFFWAADVYRMGWRYVERGYRYLYLDAGHVCQNLYLATEQIGGGCCAIGAYNDEAVDTLLGLDGEQRFTVYIATAGKR